MFLSPPWGIPSGSLIPQSVGQARLPGVGVPARVREITATSLSWKKKRKQAGGGEFGLS